MRQPRWAARVISGRWPRASRAAGISTVRIPSVTRSYSYGACSEPIRIDYSGNAAAGLAPSASVRLVYADRSDAWSFYQAGPVSNTYHTLVNIQTFVGEALVQDYRLALFNPPSF